MVSKMGRNFAFFVVLSASILSAQTPETLTNEMVFKMVQAGVPTSVILQTIGAAPRVDFSFLPRDLQAFAFYKVPDDVFKAMAAKDKGLPVPGAAANPAAAPAQTKTTAAPAVQAARNPQPARQADRADANFVYQGKGMWDIDFLGSAVIPHTSPLKTCSLTRCLSKFTGWRNSIQEEQK